MSHDVAKRVRWLRMFILAAAPTATAACQPAPPVEEVVEPGIESVVVTQWNDATELFLEYPHVVAGQPTGNWAIHLSSMATFEPIRSGTLTVTFFDDQVTAESFTIEGVARDGIFLLDPVIGAPGDYRVELSLESPQAQSVHVLSDVHVFASLEEAPLAVEEEAGAGIAFLKEQQWQIPFAVHAAREEGVLLSVTAPAELTARDGGLALVGPPVSGIAPAELNRTAPSTGQRVAAGDVLAVLNPTPGEGGYARLRGELERLEREVERAERLFAAGAIPERRLEEARHDLEIVAAEVAALGPGAGEENFQLQLRSPIAGVVAERQFIPGGRVEAGQTLFTIVDPATLWLRVQLSPGAATSLTADGQAGFSVEGVAGAFETTRRISVGSVLDPETRSVPVVFEVANPDGALKVGQFARAVVPVGDAVLGVAIPNGAIVDDNGTPVAYVQMSGETFERRILSLGASDAERTQVLSGILPGDMVVTTGAYQVRLASMSGNEFAGGHAH